VPEEGLDLWFRLSCRRSAGSWDKDIRKYRGRGLRGGAPPLRDPGDTRLESRELSGYEVLGSCRCRGEVLQVGHIHVALATPLGANDVA